MNHRVRLTNTVQRDRGKLTKAVMRKLKPRVLAGLDDDGWLALRRKGAGNGPQLDRFGTRTNDKRNFLRVQYSP